MTRLTAFCCVFLLLLAPSRADNWTGFRGDGSGTTSAHPPTHWSPEAGIAWRAEIPGYGQSSPVVWGNQIFLTSSDGPWQEEQYVHAFDLKTGERRWSQSIPASLPVENYFRNSRAAPTCCVDASAVYSFFPSGDITRMNHGGDTIWSRPIIKEQGAVENERGVASSLTQTNDRLFVLVDHHGPSYLIALNKSDGSICWKADRGKRQPSWSSPVIAMMNNRELVITSSADTVDGYDAATGSLFWQLDGLQGNHIPSASVVGNRIYIGSTTMFGMSSDEGEVAGSNCCLELSDGGTRYELLWGAERANSYYSSPLCFAGFVYYVSKAGVLYCVDAQSGRRHFAKRIGNPCWASAIGVTTPGGDKLVYFFTQNGFTLVLRPGKEYDLVARNALWDRNTMMAAQEAAQKQRKANRVPSEESPQKTGPEAVFAGMPERQLHAMFSYRDPIVYGAASVGNRLLLRTGQSLYCIANSSTFENESTGTQSPEPAQP